MSNVDKSTALALNEMNKRFYDTQAHEFAATRNNSWRGWRHALEASGWAREGNAPERLDVLDVACGNLRFEAWLARELPACALRVDAVDACVDLLPDEIPAQVAFRECDIVSALLDGAGAAVAPQNARYDLVTSFGFMHHVPGHTARVALLDALLGTARVGGLVVVSFWRFADEEGLAARAKESTAQALAGDAGELALDEGDYLLGFGESSTALRYCHSFSDADIDEIMDAAKTPFELVARYRADGRNNALNEYLVMRRV